MRGAQGTMRLAAAIVMAAMLPAVTGCGSAGSPPKGGVALSNGGELAAWSPNGRVIAVPDWNGVELMRPDGSVARRLSAPGVESRKVQCECSLGWSADGSEVHFVTRSHFGNRGVMVGRVSVDGGRPEEVPLGVPGGDTAWSPRGWPLVFVSNSVASRYATSKRGPSPDLWRLDGLHARPRKILSEPGFEIRPEFSPDGSRIVYVRKRHGHRSVWVVNADGSDPHPVARGYWLAFTAWSPDGKRLAIAAASEGKGGAGSHVYVASPSGERLRRLPRTAGAASGIAWTPNGRFVTYTDLAGKIWRIRPDGSEREKIGDLPEHDVRRLLWSPDGKRLAYTARKLDESD